MMQLPFVANDGTSAEDFTQHACDGWFSEWSEASAAVSKPTTRDRVVADTTPNELRHAALSGMFK